VLCFLLLMRRVFKIHRPEGIHYCRFFLFGSIFSDPTFFDFFLGGSNRRVLRSLFESLEAPSMRRPDNPHRRASTLAPIPTTSTLVPITTTSTRVNIPKSSPPVLLLLTMHVNTHKTNQRWSRVTCSNYCTHCNAMKRTATYCKALQHNIPAPVTGRRQIGQVAD